MTDLRTTYMGLELDNPLVVASCSLSKTLEGIRKCADAGAGAVVLKSIFEEQISGEMKKMEPDPWIQWHSEAFQYTSNLGMELGPREYLKLIGQAKAKTSFPIIASLNCISQKWWGDFAQQVEAAGADALELNISFMPSDPGRSPADIEKQYCSILEETKKLIRIPVAVKIGPYFTSVAAMAGALDLRGAAALVLFNRFFRFDIDIENLKISAGHRFSSAEEINRSLRWMSLLSGRVRCDLAASTGVHDHEGVIKQLLAGATVVQLCSTLYINGLTQIGAIRGRVEEWMKAKDFASVSDFRGKMSQLQSDKPELYERLQYIKSLVGIE
ncbi:MAG: dihydroorotate dehydrogenase-like protein [Pseudomonadota bacterium]